MTETKETIAQCEKLIVKDAIPPDPDSGFVKVLRSCFIIPQRYVLGLMSLLCVCNAYTMRLCLNIAITQMVNHTKIAVTHNITHNEDLCPSEAELSNTTTVPKENPYAIYDWDEATQGFILSGFYYGYITTQLMGGSLSQRIGAKWVISSGLLCTALLTLATPFAIRTGGAHGLFALRVLQGIGEGPTIPSLMTVMSRWVPPNERSFYGALVFGGGQLGNVFGSTVSGVLLADSDWVYVFYFFGVFGLLWFVFWSLLCYSTPQTHPFISKKELDYLQATIIVADKRSSKDPVPWKAILRSAPMWALIFGAIGHDWGVYTMLSDLPKYTNEVLKFNISSTGILTSLPFIAMWASAFLFGFIADFCIKKKWHTVRTGRIIHTSIAATGPAICIILASYSGCNRMAAIVYFIVSMGLMGGFYSGMKVNQLDISPNYTGSVAALLNTISTLTGIISPYLTGLMTPDSTVSQWRMVFWVTFALLVGTNVVYCIWAEGEQQWWDDVRKFGYPPGWKHGPLLDEHKGKELKEVTSKV